MTNDLDTTCFVIVGDWNANIRNGGESMFARHMSQLCTDNSYILSSQALLPTESYTHVSEAWGSVSWLDHIVSSADFHHCIQTVSIDYDISDVDHIPVLMDISLDDIPETSVSNHASYRRLSWDKLTADDRAKYFDVSHDLLSRIEIPDAVHCTDVNCCDASHINDTNLFYEQTMRSLIQASDTVFSNPPAYKGIIKPGWSDYVAELYNAHKDVARLWCNAGKPRNGDLFELRRVSKARYKYALRFIKRNEADMRKESLGNKLADSDSREFWKEIKGVSNAKMPLPTSIEGVTGESNIASVWRDHYNSVFNSTDGGCYIPNFSKCNDVYEDILVLPNEIAKAINDLDGNKSCGLDGIYAEHLKLGSRLLFTLLGHCLTSFFVHGFLPKGMIDNVLVPVIKSKTGRIMSKDNYRPIALASVVSKVAESIIFNRISCYLDTCPNQFGFKRNHGTDQCIYVLKEIIDAYRVMNGSVFTCFLDASKAFDRVNHCILFTKLGNRGTPQYIIRILSFWYANQQMCIRWGGTYSTFFNVSNGVRQGSILSPYLFNIYIDDLSVNLNACRVGCCVGIEIINHLMYADDLVVMAPSVAGLSKLLRMCELFGASHDMIFNQKKSASVYFISKTLKGAHLPNVYLNGEVILQVDSVKYLGHHLTNDLHDDLDIRRQCRAINVRGNILFRKFHMCSVSVKLKLFNSYCASMYTPHLWWNYKKMSICKLQITYHNILKMNIGLSKYESTSATCATTNTQCCQSVIRNLVYKFVCRLDKSNNTIVKALLSSSIVYSSRIRSHWRGLLYVHGVYE